MKHEKQNGSGQSKVGSVANQSISSQADQFELAAFQELPNKHALIRESSVSVVDSADSIFSKSRIEGIASDLYNLLSQPLITSGDLLKTLKSYCMGALNDTDLKLTDVDTKAFSKLKYDLVARYLTAYQKNTTNFNTSNEQAIVEVGSVLQKWLERFDSAASLDNEAVNEFLQEQKLKKFGALAFQGPKDNPVFLHIEPRLFDGHEVAASEAGDLFRVYVNSHPNSIPDIVNTIIEDPELIGTLHSLKVIDFSNSQLADFDARRCEKMVVYVNSAGLQRVVNLIDDWKSKLPNSEGYDSTPLFAKQVQPGVAIGQEPVRIKYEQQSFSERRADLLQNVCIAAVYKLLTDKTNPQVVQNLMQLFIRGVNLAAEDPVDRQDIIDSLALENKSKLDINDIRSAIKHVLSEAVSIVNQEDFVNAVIECYPAEAKALGIDPLRPELNLT